MDPNVALANIREAVEEFEGLSEDNFVDALRQADTIVEHFKALDEWLKRDGFLPTDWQSEDEKNKPGWVDKVLGTVAEWTDEEFELAFGFSREERR
jgi:hypothetical protein